MRSRPVAFAGLLAGGLVALVSAAQPWWRAGGEGTSVAFSGTEASAGLTQALALVVLAGVLLALAVGARARRIVGATLALVGLGMGVVGALRPRPNDAAVLVRLRQVSLVDQFAVSPTAWPLAYAGAGTLVLAGALVMVARAGRWPQRVDRFARAGRPEDAGGGLGPAEVDDALSTWQALDAGLDPTDGPQTQPGADPPNVQSGILRDTMGARHDSDSSGPPEGRTP